MIDKDSKKLFCVETFFKKKHNELTALPKLVPYIYMTLVFLALVGASYI